MSAHDQTTSTLKIMLFFTVMMVTMPIFLYFVSKYVLETVFLMSSAYIYSAGVAVLTVHVILALFLYVAWHEDSPSKQVKAD